jgi:hypothetical protein
MKNRIQKLTTPSSDCPTRLWLDETEWSQIQKEVPAAKRIKVTVELELSPLQHRALMWVCKTLFVTPSEFVASALVTDLGGHNNVNEEIWRAGVIEGVLALFPEREKDLGDLCDAYQSQAQAVRGAGRTVDAERKKLASRGQEVTV